MAISSVKLRLTHFARRFKRFTRIHGSKRKGTRNEHRSMRLLEASGYSVTRAAASLGVWDLVGISATGFCVVQVKSNRPSSPAERETLASFQCPPDCWRLIHVWKDRARAPVVTVL